MAASRRRRDGGSRSRAEGQSTILQPPNRRYDHGMRSSCRLLVLVTVLVAARAVADVSGWSPARPAILPDAEIRQLLADRIDTLHESVGIVVGVIEPEGRRVVAYGKMGAADPRPVTGDT